MLIRHTLTATGTRRGRTWTVTLRTPHGIATGTGPTVARAIRAARTRVRENGGTR